MPPLPLPHYPSPFNSLSFFLLFGFPPGLSIDDFYDIDSSYGTSQQLKTLTTALRLKGIAVGVEMVLARGFNAEQAQLNTFHNTVEVRKERTSHHRRGCDLTAMTS